MKNVVVVIEAGSIGQAIVRRISACKHVLLADPPWSHSQHIAGTPILQQFIHQIDKSAGTESSVFGRMAQRLKSPRLRPPAPRVPAKR